MNREILFRGKRVDNGEWVYGYYIVAAGMPFISTFGKKEPIAVIPETVGQYTGLKDKNGTKIYEGDVVLYNSLFPQRKKATVIYENGAFKILKDYKFKSYLDEKQIYKDMGASFEFDLDLEVIGNIHDKG